MGYIYVITNTANGTQYVGQTKRTIEKRWKGHQRDAYRIRNEKNLKVPLYCAIRKYGVKTFSVEELEECSNEKLDEREKYWIAKLDTFYGGYNATKGGQNCGTQPKIKYDDVLQLFILGESIKSIAKQFGTCANTISEMLQIYDDFDDVKAKQHIDLFTKLCGTPICQYSLKGDFVADYESIASAPKATNIAAQMIHSCCIGKTAKAKGFQFKYKGDSPTKVNKGCGKEISQYDFDGSFIAHYINGAEAEKVSGVSGACIRQCCRGESKYAGKYVWKYEIM